MAQSEWLSVVSGVLCILSACMLFLVISPKYAVHQRWLDVQFSGATVTMLLLFYLVEGAQPNLYMYYLLPMCLLATVIYNKLLSSVINCAILISYGILFMNTDLLWLVMMNVGICGSGILLEPFLLQRSLHKRYGYALCVVCIYFMLYIGIDWLSYGELQATEYLLSLGLMSLISAIPVSYICSFINNQLQLQRDLVLSEKYQSIGQLAASISHEIRNPLTTTRGFLQLMNMDKLSKEKFESYRTYAVEGLDHANNIITDYLNFSKPSLETPKRLNVKSELNSVVQWLEPYSVEMNVTIVTHHLSEENLYIVAQTKQFQQCILNIMKNAIESMTEGGFLTLHTRLQDNQVQLLIRDTGIGMSEEQLKRIGTPYFTMKESGTGLGLMVVMSLVKAMNGKIFFRSKPNQGTICELHFRLDEALESYISSEA